VSVHGNGRGDGHEERSELDGYATRSRPSEQFILVITLSALGSRAWLRLRHLAPCSARGAARLGDSFRSGPCSVK
jgi:hypothetical protein